MNEKLKDQDLLLVSEKDSNKLNVVSGINEDGTPKTVKPEQKNEPDFLKIDKDGAVPWYQGIEYFMALRRLGKPVWLLQYNNEEHNLRERRNTKDLTIRLQQFFDHYLKGDPMPVWMSKGVPAIDKGKTYGLELE